MRDGYSASQTFPVRKSERQGHPQLGWIKLPRPGPPAKLFEEMAQGTAEARAYMEGERKGYKVTLPETVDVRGLRKRLRLSQGRFADRFGLSVDAVRHWESGRRQPEATARALLIIIAGDPEFVMRSLAKSA